MVTYFEQQEIHKLERALRRIERTIFFEPPQNPSWTTEDIAQKFRLSSSHIRDIQSRGILPAERVNIHPMNYLQGYAYRSTEQVIYSFLKPRLKNPTVSVGEVLNSRLLLLSEVCQILGFCEDTIEKNYIQRGHLTYLSLGDGYFREHRRYVGLALEYNVLQILGFILDIKQPPLSTRMLARKWGVLPESVLFHVEQGRLHPLNIGDARYPHYIYAESDVQKLAKAKIRGRPRKHIPLSESSLPLNNPPS